jgi:tetratricopeptide (TPR) repeat protein
LEDQTVKACHAALQILLGVTLAYGQSTDPEKLRQTGLAEYGKGHFAEAEKLLGDALKYHRESKADRDIALDLSALGDIYNSELRRNEAELAYKEALSIFSRLPDGALLEAITLRNLASVYSGQQRYKEALAALRKASKLTAKNKIGGDVFAAQILNTFGVIYFAQGKLKQAETSFKRAAQIWMAPGTKPNLDLAQSLHNLAVLLQRRGKYRDAEDLYSKSLQITEELSGPSHRDLSRILTNFGLLYLRMGRYGDAENQLRRSLAILEETVPRPAALMIQTLHGLGKTCLAKGDKAGAETFLVRAVELARQNPSSDPEILAVLDTYRNHLQSKGDFETAKQIDAEARRARAVMSLTVPGSAEW